jgi:hypothetical protein
MYVYVPHRDGEDGGSSSSHDKADAASCASLRAALVHSIRSHPACGNRQKRKTFSYTSSPYLSTR